MQAAGEGSSPATFRTLLVLALPVVGARATQSIVGFTDALMIAPFGKAAVASVTTGAMNSFTLMILPMGMSLIIQSFAAQLTGQGRLAEARRYAWYGLAVAAVAMVAAVAALPLVPAVLGWIRMEPDVRALMTDYMELRLLSIGAAVGIEVLGSWYGGLGNTRMHLYAGATAMVLNVGLNWILIYGHLGAPELGVSGAALASTLSTWLAFAGLAWAFHRGWGGAPRPAGALGLRRRELWRVIRFGLPNGINWFLEFAAFIVFLNVVVVDLGTTALAAMGVVLQVNSVSFMPAFGLASAGAILAGQAIGRGEHDQVRGVLFLTMRTAAVWQVSIGLAYLLAPEAIIDLFDSEEAVIDAASLAVVGTLMLQLSAAWQIFDATSMTLSEVLRSAGDTTWPMLARLGLAWVLFVPASVLAVMVLDGGEVAAMVCLIAYIAALAGLLAYRFATGAWRRIDLTGHAEPTVD